MMRREHAAGDEGFGLIEVVVAIVILGLIAAAMLPLFITGLQIAGNQSTVASATRLLNDTIEQVRVIALDPTIDCADVEITNAATDGRGIDLVATTTVLSNQHLAPAVPPAPAAPVRKDLCLEFTAPGSLTVEITVREDGETNVLAEATTIVSVRTPPEETP